MEEVLGPIDAELGVYGEHYRSKGDQDLGMRKAASAGEESTVSEYKSDQPCEFNERVGVAFRDARLFVSESHGRRIQILRFCNGFHGAVECLQVIRSPNGMELA